MDLILSLALSTHLNLVSDLNEVHPHIRVHDEHIIAGAYVNSNGDPAVYAGFTSDKYSTDKFFAEYGVSIWQSYGGGKIHPFARVGYKLNKHVDIWASPAIEYLNNGDTNAGAVLAIEFKQKF